MSDAIAPSGSAGPDAGDGSPHPTDQSALSREPQIIAPPTTGLAANNIGKAYRGRVVVKDITLTVQRGEVVALMGPNGAGKTTS